MAVILSEAEDLRAAEDPMDEKGWSRVMNLVGLGIRGRLAVVGVERVREAAMKGTLQLALVAPDASRHSREKVLPLLAAKGVPVLEGASAATLGGAVGREATAVIGIVDAQLAKGIRAIADAVVRGSAQERMV